MCPCLVCPRHRLIVILLLLVLSVPAVISPTPVLAADTRSEASSSPERPFEVWVLEDGRNADILAAAWDIQRPLRNHGITVQSISVEGLLEMAHLLSVNPPDAAVYLFESSLDGVLIGDLRVSWSDIAHAINQCPGVHHIFGIGNAERLLDYTSPSDNLHIEGADIIDLRLTVLHTLWTTVEILADSGSKTYSKTGEELRRWVLQDFANDINEIVSKGLIPDTSTGERAPGPIENPALTKSWIVEEPQYDEAGNELMPVMRLTHSAQDDEDYIPLREMSPTSGVGGAIGWLLDTLLDAVVNEGLQDLEINVEAAEEINDYIIGVIDDAQNETLTWFLDEGFNITGNDYSSAIPELLPREMSELWSLSDDIILDAFYEIDDWLTDWVEEVVETPVQTDLRGLVPVFMFRLGTPLNLGTAFASFGAVIRVKLLPTFELDKTAFEAFMNDAVFGTYNLSSITDVEDAFTQVRAFIDVIPVMDIDLGICAFLPTQSDWVQTFMSDLSIEFSGSAHAEFAFPPVDASNTERAFIEVREWSLEFDLDASYTMTIATLFAGAASGIINTILDKVAYLLGMSVTLTLSIMFEISKVYQGQGLPALSTFVLDITIGATLDIKLLVVVFSGTISVGMSFEQKSGILSSSAVMMALAEDPMLINYIPSAETTSTLDIYMKLYCSLYLGIDLWLVEFGTDFGGPWTDTYLLSTSSETTNYSSESADLTDTDNDGLPDAFETRMNTMYGSTYINPNSADTDGDGLNDKLELELNTEPNDDDTDVDGLTDYEEHVTYRTDPLLTDSDFDKLTDYQEVKTYGTNPLVIDTDGDGLYDYFEINTTYDVSHTYGSYGAVTGVKIGKTTYNDRTDPLDPDTDNDGLLDGVEWKNGVEYANQSVVGTNKYVYLRWTHPLDSDSDDDSVLWMYDSGSHTFHPSSTFLMDMNDGVEVLGQYFTFTDEEGYPEVKLIKTNPVNPDTDNDTGMVLKLNSDAYELCLTPPTDPTNGDTDHDGLIDGEEAIGPLGYGTDPNNPDTDNDHLPDYEDAMLPTDPRDPDSDDDTVLDGDEYYLYGTNPLENDTDLDGLTDGEELFFFYCNPTVRDSDFDGLTDGEEILIYLTDPLLKDSDNDRLHDGYEVFYSHTDPRLFDTDGDMLGDGDELIFIGSNPLDWDTDGDSLKFPNEAGSMTLPLSDGDEVLTFHTSPINVDTDSDGLTDAQELYLAAGSPAFSPVALNPLDNDTDHDGLLDGEEMILETVTIITYPYVGLMRTLRYGTCPALNDTDSDGVGDKEELVHLCDPTSADTDSDRLSDYVEIYITGTSPISNDTDGDELPDWMESYDNATPAMLAEQGFTSHILAQGPGSFYPTSATDSDSDNDLLPDGLEYIYHTDPLKPDGNANGVLDGYEFDADGDGLSDGEEFYVYKTYLAPLPIENGSWTGDPGGFDNPDSDGDGLDDGLEVLTYGSDPTGADSDGDGISDGEEVQIGGNPIIPITSGLPSGILVTIGVAGGFFAGIFLETTLLVLKRGGFSVRRFFGGIGRSLLGSGGKKAPPTPPDTESVAKAEPEPVKSMAEEGVEKTAPRKRKTTRTSAKSTKEGGTE